MKKLVICVNTSHFFLNHRLALAKAAKAQGYEVFVGLPKGQDTDQIARLGFKFFQFYMNRKGLNPIVELYTLLSIYKGLKHIQPDVLHCFTIKCNVYGAICAKFLKVSKIILTITGMGSLFQKPDIFHKTAAKIVLTLYRWALGSPNIQLIVQNPTDYNFFIDQRIAKKSQCHIIPGTGVDLAEYHFDRQKQNDTKVILYSGRLLYDKGLTELVAACKELAARSFKFELQICGQFDYENPNAVSEKQMQSWAQEQFIKFLGYQNNMTEIYLQSDIICLPSYREGLPLTLIEAGACGLPSVTTDVPGCRDVIKHEFNGLIVPAKDSNSLANALEKLLTDEQLCDRLGRSARKLVEQKFQQRQLVREHIELYEG